MDKVKYSLKLNKRPKHPRYIPSIWLHLDEFSSWSYSPLQRTNRLAVGQPTSKTIPAKQSAPNVGLEPTTLRLRVSCLPTELAGHVEPGVSVFVRLLLLYHLLLIATTPGRSKLVIFTQQTQDPRHVEIGFFGLFVRLLLL